MNFQIWLPILALLLGAILHSLSDDGGASILAHFGIAARLPTALLPVAVLVFGAASGTLDSVVAGSDWQHALATAAAAAIATIFGATAQHGLTNKTVASPSASVSPAVAQARSDLQSALKPPSTSTTTTTTPTSPIAPEVKS